MMCHKHVSLIICCHVIIYPVFMGVAEYRVLCTVWDWSLYHERGCHNKLLLWRHINNRGSTLLSWQHITGPYNGIREWMFITLLT